MCKKIIAFLLSVLMLQGLLAGCHKQAQTTQTTLPTQATEAVIEATVPADGDPDGVACKGSYSAEKIDADTVVASVEDHQLTLEQLQVWYWLAVAERMAGQYDAVPDFSQPLDTQPCPIDDSVNSWQQYFLKKALNTWHTVCALELQARTQELPLEEAYQPNLKNHEIYLVDIPATDYLYGYTPLFQPNSMHSNYLAALPETLEALAGEMGYDSLEDMAAKAFGSSGETLTDAVYLYNYSYMYFTTLSYYIECGEEEVQSYLEANSGNYTGNGACVDIRQILLVPGDEENPVSVAQDGTVSCSEEQWTACMTEAEELLEYWRLKTKHNEAAFADLANKNSEDAGSALNGGAYRNIRQGQLIDVLDQWCFDEARQEGDTVILRSEYGCHILYFSGSVTESYARAEKDLTEQTMAELVQTARERYPADIDFGAITLLDAEGGVSADQVLYPDIAHERFPEVPLYLQQDYPSTMYGGYRITTNGCGITSFAMLASYMADDELTPPEMCALYGNYSHSNGTDGMLFNYEPSALGFYLREKTYDPNVAKAALEEGQIVISIQHKGYWTGGGHYIVLEDINEEGLVQVRDSNIYNYGKLKAHKEDRHTWGSITSNGSGFWIYEDKVTHIPACSRCGDQEGMDASPLTVDYICEKCTPALLRRNAYLKLCGADLM